MLRWPKYGVISFLACYSLVLFSSSAQSNIEIAASYVGGLGEDEILIWNSSINPEFSSGFDLRGIYTYKIKPAPIQAVAQLGYKQLNFSGSGSDDNSSYKGVTKKLSFALGGRYLIDDRWVAGAYLDIENNLDFDDYRTQTTDLLRYAAIVEVIYRIKYDIGISVAYSRAFYPLQDHYLIFNPANQFRLGINWAIL